MIRHRKFFILILTCIVAVLCFAGNSYAGEKSAEIAYVEWSSATAASNVVKAVLQEKMGYDCKLTAASAAGLWQFTASGDADGFVCAWLPSLHRHYYAKVEDNVVDLGPNLEGTKVGIVVPAYVDIDSIAQLDSHAEKFDKRIIGIDPGAGIMYFTEKAIEAYNMESMELIPGSGAMMTSVLAKKIRNKQWVAVTGWTPHWKFARWDLKYLQDSENVYGGSESINTVVRKDLKKENPELYQFLDNFRWGTEDINKVMDMIQKSGKPYASAVKWVNQHPEKIQAWLPDNSSNP